MEKESDKEKQRGERLNTALRKGIAAPIKDFSNPLTMIPKQARYRPALRPGITHTEMSSVECSMVNEDEESILTSLSN